MKTHAGAWMLTLLLAGIGSALHAADEQTLEQALNNWSSNTNQTIESSGAQVLQQLLQDAIQMQKPQLRIRIRLSDETPIDPRGQADRNAAGNVPVSGKSPESTLPLATGELG